MGRDGLVRDAGVRHDGLPGQPAHLFAATSEAEAHYSTAYPPVLAALTSMFASRLPAVQRLEVFRATGKRLAERMPATAGAVADQAQAVRESLGAAVMRRRRGDGTILQGASCPVAPRVLHVTD
ncbi:MAG TPA: hypothetical protein VGL65_12560 [Gemmatimonadales bacterium]